MARPQLARLHLRQKAPHVTFNLTVSPWYKQHHPDKSANLWDTLRIGRDTQPAPEPDKLPDGRQANDPDQHQHPVTDAEISSNATPHTATAWPVPANPTLWSVAWLPGHALTRDQAITAMTIAGPSPRTQTRRTPPEH